MTQIRRETIAEALENDRCGACLSVDHFREECPHDDAGRLRLGTTDPLALDNAPSETDMER